VNDQDDGVKGTNSAAIIELGVWRRWRLEVLRIGTRESTVVLYLDVDGKTEEQTRRDWDSTASEPTALRAGIASSSAGAKATVLVDELRVTESLLDD
jgi:hypothetical protein